MTCLLPRRAIFLIIGQLTSAVASGMTGEIRAGTSVGAIIGETANCVYFLACFRNAGSGDRRRLRAVLSSLAESLQRACR